MLSNNVEDAGHHRVYGSPWALLAWCWMPRSDVGADINIISSASSLAECLPFSTAPSAASEGLIAHVMQ